MLSNQPIVKRITNIEVTSFGSPPDIDTDFAPSIRDDVYQYVIDTYGHERVANIGTLGLFKAKSALKDVLRVYGVEPAEQNRITKLIPDPIDGEDPTIEDLYNEDSVFYKAAQTFRDEASSPAWQTYIELAAKLQGRIRSISRHACGVIIAGSPITAAIPITIDKKTGYRVTQWDASSCEARGFLKIDMLGLETIDTTLATLRYVEAAGKPVPNLVELIQGPMDDPDVYTLFQAGRTSGIFQFSSEGMRTLLRAMKPTCFDDLVAAVALYRPGPMEMGAHEHYAARKNGDEPITPLHPSLAGTVVDEILAPTYGLCIYQEQISMIAIRVAGMDQTQADAFRKAMGKKKKDVMAKMYPLFMDGGLANGFTREGMQALWDMIEPFAKYAFNKSHSVAYAMNSYQAAYLKAHYPTESMAAFIAQAEQKDAKTVKRFLMPLLYEAKHQMGMRVVNGQINRAHVYASPMGEGVIQMGLASCKGVGKDLALHIIDERTTHGPFTSPANLVARMNRDSRQVNRQHIVTLATAGLFDEFGVSRKQVVDHADKMVAYQAVETGWLFDEVANEYDAPLDGEDWSPQERIHQELTVLPFAVSGHPMDHWPVRGPISDPVAGKDVTAVASVVTLDLKTLKGGGTFGSIVLDDTHRSLSAKLDRETIALIQAQETKRLAEQMISNGKLPDHRQLAIASNVWQHPIAPLHIVHTTLQAHPSKPGEFLATHIDGIYTGSNNLPAVRVRLPHTVPAARLFEMLTQFCTQFPGVFEIHAAQLVDTGSDRLSQIDQGARYQALIHIDSQRTQAKQAAAAAKQAYDRAVNSADQGALTWLDNSIGADIVEYKQQWQDAKATVKTYDAQFEQAAGQIWLCPSTVTALTCAGEEGEIWRNSQQYWPSGLSTSQPKLLCETLEHYLGAGMADCFLLTLDGETV